MQIKELFTRARHNEGVNVDVKNEEGKLVGWIRVRGLDSDAYRAASDGAHQALVRLAGAVRAAGEGAPLLAATQTETDAAKLATRVALVAAWSFEEPCDETHVAEALREWPALSDQIYTVACDRDRFLESKLPASTDGPATSSTSENPQPPEPSIASPTP
jgi:hypothetical protein